MLAFTRRPGESFTIGGDITVTIVDVMSSKSVRITVDAPDDVEIVRHNAKRQTRGGDE